MEPTIQPPIQPVVQSRFPQPVRYLLIGIIPLCALTYSILPPKHPLNPLGHADSPTIVRQALAQPEVSSLAYYLAGSEKYLNEARVISRQTATNQTEEDKKKIISLLNSSLQMANNAVTHYTQNPEGYTQRARLFEVLATIDPTAKGKAETDRQLASRLTGVATNPASSPITPVDLVRAAPLEEASLISQAIIALPQEGQAATDTKETANALRGQATLPAGQTDIVVTSSAVRDDLLIYYTPQGDTQGQVLSLKNKSEAGQKFTLHLSTPITQDLKIDWWIVESSIN
ncbi:MAG: hypothetical protein WCL07_01395 [bacterium]